MIELHAIRIGELLGPMATLIVGTALCCLTWLGLRRMERASRQRDRHMENQSRDAERRHGEASRDAERRHEEAMTALRALIERTAGSGPSSRA